MQGMGTKFEKRSVASTLVSAIKGKWITSIDICTNQICIFHKISALLVMKLQKYYEIYALG